VSSGSLPPIRPRATSSAQTTPSSPPSATTAAEPEPILTCVASASVRVGGSLAIPLWLPSAVCAAAVGATEVKSGSAEKKGIHS